MNAFPTRRFQRFALRLALLVSGGGALTASQPAHALDLLTLGSDLSALTDTGLSDMVEATGIAVDHRAYAPASRMGGWLGLDLGADLSLTGLPDSVQAILALVASSSVSSLPVIHLSARKGFGPVSVGFSYFSLSGLSIVGGDAQWSILNKASRAALAIRGGFSSASLWFLSTTTFSVDVVGSYSLGGVLEPYAGLGAQFGSGSITLTTQTLPVGLSASSSFFAPRFTVGMQLKLLLLKIVPEFSYSFSGLSTYGARVALAF